MEPAPTTRSDRSSRRSRSRRKCWRAVSAWCLGDLSPAVDFGSDEVTKRAVRTEFVAGLARLLSRQGYKVGGLLYDVVILFVVPPRGGREHVLHLINRVMSNPRLLRAPKTDLGVFLTKALGVPKRRSLVCAISDFVSAPGWERSLSMLARRHELLAVRLIDPLDRVLPDVGVLPFEDSESGEQVFVDTGGRRFRERFVAAAAQNEEQLFAAYAAAGCDVLELSTSDDLVEAIRRFADLRKAQRALRGGGTMPAHLTGAVDPLEEASA